VLRLRLIPIALYRRLANAKINHDTINGAELRSQIDAATA